MKVEIDTINKTIKVLENSTIEEVFDMMVEIPNFKEYKFIPNNIYIETRIPLTEPYNPWIQPYYTNPYNPYIVTCVIDKPIFN